MKPKFSMLALVATVTVQTATAQSGRLDPADPAAPTPDVKRESVFPQYQRYEEPELADWKQALDELASRAPAQGHGGMHGKQDRAGQGASADAGHEGHVKPKPATPAAKAASKRHEHMAMAKQPSRGSPRTDLVSATGIIREIDKANRRIKITHEPIEALGWPRLTVFVRLKDNALAETVRQNEKVRFTLEKTASGYVIAGIQKQNDK